MHIAEWLATGRVDLGLLYNPEPAGALEIAPVLEERLCLIGKAAALKKKTVALKDLGRYPLVMPQRGHIFRRLMETQAALAGVRLDVAWEVSSVPAILDLVLGGHGYAALTDSAIRTHARREELSVAPIRAPEIRSMLCLALSAQKRRTPLITRSARALAELCRSA